MQLEELANLSEVIGAFAIIISLIFLIFEVRRNTNESKRQFMEGVTSQRTSFVRLLSTDEELARLIMQGLTGSGLAAHQWFQFNMYLYALFVDLEFTKRRYDAGEMDSDLWEAWLDAFQWWLQFPGVRKWWAGNPAGYTKPFRKFVDARIEKQSVADDELLSQMKSSQMPQ